MEYFVRSPRNALVSFLLSLNQRLSAISANIGFPCGNWAINGSISIPCLLARSSSRKPTFLSSSLNCSKMVGLEEGEKIISWFVWYWWNALSCNLICHSFRVLYLHRDRVFAGVWSWFRLASSSRRSNGAASDPPPRTCRQKQTAVRRQRYVGAAERVGCDEELFCLF